MHAFVTQSDVIAMTAAETKKNSRRDDEVYYEYRQGYYFQCDTCQIYTGKGMIKALIFRFYGGNSYCSCTNGLTRPASGT